MLNNNFDSFFSSSFPFFPFDGKNQIKSMIACQCTILDKLNIRLDKMQTHVFYYYLNISSFIAKDSFKFVYRFKRLIFKNNQVFFYLKKNMLPFILR